MRGSNFKKPCFFALIRFLFKVESKQFLLCNRLNRFYLVRGLPRFYLIKDFCSWINVFECNRWNLWSESLEPCDLAFSARKFADISFRFSEISSNFRELGNSSDLAKFHRTFVNYRENGVKVCTKYRQYFVESSREQLTKFVEVRS